MTVVIQVLVSGLAVGGIAGVGAIVVSLLYRLTGVVLLALGGLMSVAIVLVAAPSGPSSAVLVPLAVTAAMGLAVITYRVAIADALAADERSWVVAVVASAALLDALARIGFRGRVLFVPAILGTSTMRVAGAVIETREVLVAALAALLAGAGAYVLARTRPGRALRAITDDRAAALLVGIPAARLTAITFAIAGGLAAVAAIAASAGGPADASTGELLGARAVAIAFAVGFAGPGRAYLAGLAFGVLEEAVSAVDLGSAALASSATVVPLLGCLVLGLLRGRST